MKNIFFFLHGPFFHKSNSKKEEIRELYGKCGQKSMRETNHIYQISYLHA